MIKLKIENRNVMVTIKKMNYGKEIIDIFFFYI